MPSSAVAISRSSPVSGRLTGRAPAFSAFVVDGLASDAVLGALGARLAAIRLVFAAAAPKRCCAGHAPDFIALGAEDPAVANTERGALAALAPGRAVPGTGLQALAGGIVALPGIDVEIAPPAELGPGLEHVVVLALCDAARGLAHAGEATAMTPRTVAIVHGTQSLPAPWQAASGAGERVALNAGLTPLAGREMAA